MSQTRQIEQLDAGMTSGFQAGGPSLDSLDRGDAARILRADTESRMQATSPHLNQMSFHGDTLLCQAPVQRNPNTATDAPIDPALAAATAASNANRASDAARVAGATRVPSIPSLPSNPSSGVMDYLPGGEPLHVASPTGIVEVHRRAANIGFNPVSQALSGNRPGDWNRMGSSTMPTGMFSSTPDVTFGINYRGRGTENVTVPIPPVSGGQRVDFYQNGHQIQARSGRDTYTLNRTTNSLLPDCIAAGWEWKKN